MYNSQTALSIATFVDAFTSQLVLRISSPGILQKVIRMPTTGILPPDDQVYGLAKGGCCYPLTSQFSHSGQVFICQDAPLLLGLPRYLVEELKSIK